MDDKAVEAKLERIHAHATIALELITYGFKDKDLDTMRRHLNHVLAASTPFATRNLNHIPDPMDNIGDYEKDELKEMGPDYDAMGNEASMDPVHPADFLSKDFTRTYPDDVQTQGGPCVDDIPTGPTPGCPF